MKYEVYTPYSFLRNRDQYLFDSFEEIAEYYSYEIFCQNFNNARIIDTYDRQRVDPAEVIGIARRKRNEYLIQHYLRRYGPYEFRRGPVPRLRRGRRHRGSWTRRPKTFQRRAEALYSKYDDEIRAYKIKVNKKAFDLPTYRDDLSKSGMRDKNWKRYRNRQWKEK